MFFGDHDWLDELTNELDPLHFCDLDGDGYTTFEEGSFLVDELEEEFGDD